MINKNFFKSVATLITGSLIAQFFSFLVIPIMTRIYTADDIGFNTLLLTIVTMFGPILSLKLEVPIVSEKDIRIVNSLGKISFYLSIFLSLLIGLLSTIYYFNNLSFFEQFSYFIVIFLLLISTGINNIVVSYNNRNGEYKFITSVYVIRSFAKNILIVLGGVLKSGKLGLIISNILSQFLAMKKQLISVRKEIKNMKTIESPDLKRSIKKYKKQIIFSTPATFSNSFSYSSINIFVEKLYGLAVLGHYSISFLILGLPLSLISGNVSKVYFEEAAKEYHQTKSYNKIFVKISFILSIVSSLLFIVMYFVLPEFFILFLGGNWSESVTYIKILSPMFAIRFVVTSLSQGVVISNKQGKDFFIQLLFIIFSLTVYYFGTIFKFGMIIYLKCISLLFSIVYIVYYIYLYKISLEEVKND